MALLVTALAAALATSLLVRLDRWVDQQTAARDHAQARELARSGMDYARLLLAEDSRHSSLDHPGERWGRRLPPLSAEGGEISGYLEDLQGRWNLNNLYQSGDINPEALEIYRRLLVHLGLPGDLADTLADWMDGDESRRSGGAESDYYQSLTPAYPAANHPLEHLSNLLHVKGYDGATLARLRSHVAVLPERQAVNVNTAPAEVLAAIHPAMSLNEARELIRSRELVYFRDQADYQGRLPRPETEGAITTGSNFFLAVISAQVGETQATLQALLQRSRQNPQPRIIWQLMQ